MMFLWLPFLFLIPFVLMWMMRPGNGGAADGCAIDDAGQTHTPMTGGPDPIDIARQRLARGEVTTAEYEAIRRAIG